MGSGSMKTGAWPGLSRSGRESSRTATAASRAVLRDVPVDRRDRRKRRPRRGRATPRPYRAHAAGADRATRLGAGARDDVHAARAVSVGCRRMSVALHRQRPVRYAGAHTGGRLRSQLRPGSGTFVAAVIAVVALL